MGFDDETGWGLRVHDKHVTCEVDGGRGGEGSI